MRTGRPRQFDRDEAVRQAMHLFWQYGYESTSLAQLKAAMGRGITAPSFYAAFGSKEALFNEAVSCYLSTHARVTDSLWESTLPPREAIERALMRSARMQCEPDHPQGCMVALGVMSASSPAYRHVLKPLTDSRRRTREGLRHCVEKGISSGELRGEAGTRALAVIFDSFLLGITTLSRDGVPLSDIEAAIAQVMTLWEAATAISA